MAMISQGYLFIPNWLLLAMDETSIGHQRWATYF